MIWIHFERRHLFKCICFWLRTLRKCHKDHHSAITNLLWSHTNCNVYQVNCVLYWLCNIHSLKHFDPDNLLFHFPRFKTMRLRTSGCVVFKKYKQGISFCELNCQIFLSKIFEIICSWFLTFSHENQQGSATNKFQIQMCNFLNSHLTLYKTSFLEVLHDAPPQPDKPVDVPKLNAANMW